MGLSEFRKMCMKRKKSEEELKEKHKDLISKQETVLSMRCWRPKYKLFRGYFCPVCGKKLIEIRIDDKYILSCECGYEYAGFYRSDI